jgi:Na+-translocating ferredoxin:NAD+ oxidoreductase subunit B
MSMDSTVIIAIATMGGLGLFFAAVLAIADRKLHVQESPLLAQVIEALPQSNCGACGSAGCRDFATRLLAGKVPLTGCPIGGAELAEQLGEILQMEAGERERLVARLLCRGDAELAALKPAHYLGPRSCALQALVSGGERLCLDGCLGGGDCLLACPVGAIWMGPGGLPYISEALCTGCGLCVKACPRGVLELHPADREIFVFCKNRDNPRVARQVCAAACTGCGVCARFSEGAIEIQDNLAVIDYQRLDPEQAPLERCKPQALRRIRD